MQKNIYSKVFKFLFVLVVGIYLTTFLGCKKEPEKPVEKPTQVAPVVEEPKPVEEPKVVYPDLVGKWTGVFDSRATTLEIIKQDSVEFSGKITIRYKEIINQELNGKLNLEKMKVSMKDLLHSRYMGVYSAKVSEDFKKLTGTFTMNADKKNYSFSLTKK
ncbi:MAG: hypothetical protein NTX22_15095 [Ignavibacteriales bacterium]|nr:hypothetical protein [Ignavibacteriales bacterium]